MFGQTARAVEANAAMSSDLCFVCQHGPAEKCVKRYDFSVCRGCWSENWDGWARDHETRIIEHLKQKGLPVPVRNVWGLFPRA